MNFIRGLYNLNFPSLGSIVTIGNFDGVHKGHQKLLEKLKFLSQNLGLPSFVIIFEPQPLEYFLGYRSPARLTRLKEKVLLFEQYGVQNVLCLKFNKPQSVKEAGDFIKDILIKKLNVRHLEIGDDFRFGLNRKGDFELLKKASKKYLFSLNKTSSIKINNERVSSSLIRNSLHQNDFKYVQNLLGRDYSISGKVIKGQRLARQLGSPTANIQLKRINAPLKGVYCVYSYIKGAIVYGVANIGVRPSVNSDKKPHLEVHFLNFSSCLYDDYLTIYFMSKLRDEMKFSSLNDLKLAISNDINNAQKYWRKNPQKSGL